MSAYWFWKARLDEGCPIWRGDYRADDFMRFADDRGNRVVGAWPYSVWRGGLYKNYYLWCRTEHPTLTPESDDAFFKSMSPWLYVVDKKLQTISMPMKQPTIAFRSKDITYMRVPVYFVRLAALELHRAVFRNETDLVQELLKDPDMRRVGTFRGS